uniref:Alanine--glyoxylate aminotransferase n=1 Tax=Heterodera glycines TaxID=51029 RepID=Q9BJ55_HETGL|nr:class V aminotransferase [Heterodera glycines]
MLSRMLSSAVAVPRMCESNKKLLRKGATFVGLLCGRMANSTFTATVTPPHRLLRPLHINEKKLFGPGPSNMPPLVQEGLVQPLLGHMHPEFFEIMDDVKAGIKYIFQTENALTFAVSGTGHAGMECAILNLLEPGQTILVVQNGVWGLRAANLAERLGIKVHRLVVPEGEVINLDDFAEAVDNYRPQVAFVCHGESSTGVVHPLERFGDICNAYDVLFLVDTVASICGAPFHADALKVDCVYAATQKVLNCPPGLAPISFSEKALEKITKRKTRVPSFYFDALELGNYWGCFDEPRRYHHTAPISLVYALREGLSAVAQEGIGHMVNRHKINAKLLYDAFDQLGLELFVQKENNRLPCLTTVRVPEGVDWKAVQDKLMAQGFEIAGGLGPTAGKIWRIGTFGINSNPEDIESLKQALKGALYEQEEKGQSDHFKAAI